MNWTRGAALAERAHAAERRRLWNDAAERWRQLATEARGTPEAEVAAARAKKARAKAATAASRQSRTERARHRRASRRIR